MNWLEHAEKKFGRFAIPHLVRFVVLLSVLVFILYKSKPESLSYWTLDPQLVAKGEWWRLLTYIFIPGFGGIFGDYISLLFYVLFQAWVGDSLERAWGAFRMNLYFFLGMIGTTVAAFYFGGEFSNAILFNSIFFAFARYYGEHIIHLFFILPIKVKWLAWIDAAILAYLMLVGPNEIRISILLGLLNFFVFFGKDLIRSAKERAQISERRMLFEAKIREAETAVLHCCKTCQRTEITNPELEFRVSTDDEEYCADHLPPRKP